MSIDVEHQELEGGLMAHCPSCGADIGNSNETYGHILGCGFHSDAQHGNRDRWCPWARETQRRILAEALGVAFGVEKAWERADMVARALLERISFVTRLKVDEQERYARGSMAPVGKREAILQELDLLRRRVEELERKI